MNFYSEKQVFTFDDVTLVPQSHCRIGTRTEVDVSGRFSKNVPLKFPLVSSPMNGVTNAEMCMKLSVLGSIGVLHRFMKEEELEQEIGRIGRAECNYALAIGLNVKYLEKIGSILDQNPTWKPKALVIDIANGGLKVLYDFIKIHAKPFCEKNEIDLVAGNVCTYEMANPLLDLGIEGIRVGLSNGSNCITRVVTGHGFPQLSAIESVRDAIDKADSDCALIADGGIRHIGDLVKCLAAGADCGMSGRIFAMSKESGGWTNNNIGNGQFVFTKQYSGSSIKEGRTPEGISGTFELPPGMEPLSVNRLVEEYTGGLQSGFAYSDAFNLEELRENHQFAFQTISSYMEGMPQSGSR